MFYCYFQLAGILSFQKRYTCPEKILNIKKLFKKMWSKISLFHQILTSEPNCPMKILKFHIRISGMQSAVNNLSKTLLCIKIGQQMAEISSKEYWKTLDFSKKSNNKSVRKPWFFSSFARFSSLFWWYLSNLLADLDAK